MGMNAEPEQRGSDIPTAPDSSKASPAREPISLVLKKHRGAIRRSPFSPAAFVLYLLIVMMLILYVIPYIAGLVGGSWMFEFALLAMVVLFTLFVGFLWERKEKRTVKGLALPAPIASARLEALGRLDELEELHELQDVPFEPIIVERVYSANSMAKIWGVGYAVAFILDICVSNLLPVKTQLAPMGMAVGSILFLVLQQTNPTYFRIAPGYMDLMRFSLLTNKGRIIRVWELHKARIRVLFHEHRVEIIDPPPARSEHRIMLWALADPHRFAIGVMQGAICTHPAPPLPDDQLLG